MHNLSANALREMNEEFKDQPEALARIYKTQTGEHRYLPAHNMYEGDQYRAMNEALSGRPDILAQIYATKDRYDNLPGYRIKQ